MPRLNTLILTMLCATAITACAGKQEAAPVAQAPAPVVEQAPQEDVAPVEEVFEATPGLSARERFRKSIRLLETGEAGQAKAELEAYLAEVSNSSMGELLLEQIDTPIEDYFPADSFDVMLAAGDSLSTLAKAYLGDALKFYALSRYNEIANPSAVSVGQNIRIPATEGAIAAREMLAQMPAEPETMEPAETETVATEPAEAAPVEAEPVAPAELTGWNKVNAHAESGDYESAVAELDGMQGPMSSAEARAAATIYMASATELGRADATRAAARSLRAGALYLREADHPEMALEALQLSTSLDPANNEAQELLSTAQATVADRHYREGLAAYRKQELDKAIASWDRVLEIDPQHANASLYRAQALDLKDKLSKMK